MIKNLLPEWREIYSTKSIITASQDCTFGGHDMYSELRSISAQVSTTWLARYEQADAVKFCSSHSWGMSGHELPADVGAVCTSSMCQEAWLRSMWAGAPRRAKIQTAEKHLHRHVSVDTL